MVVVVVLATALKQAKINPQCSIGSVALIIIALSN